VLIVFFLSRQSEAPLWVCVTIQGGIAFVCALNFAPYGFVNEIALIYLVLSGTAMTLLVVQRGAFTRRPSASTPQTGE